MDIGDKTVHSKEIVDNTDKVEFDFIVITYKVPMYIKFRSTNYRKTENLILDMLDFFHFIVFVFYMGFDICLPMILFLVSFSFLKISVTQKNKHWYYLFKPFQ